MLLTFENLSRILQLEPASQPQNLLAEPQKLERMTPRSSPRREGLQCLFVLGNECSRERMVQGMNGPENESSIMGTNVPGNE